MPALVLRLAVFLGGFFLGSTSSETNVENQTNYTQLSPIEKFLSWIVYILFIGLLIFVFYWLFKKFKRK